VDHSRSSMASSGGAGSHIRSRGYPLRTARPVNSAHVMWAHRARRYHRRGGDGEPACGVRIRLFAGRWCEATEHQLLAHIRLVRCARCWPTEPT
jgi:hypothetical protein